MTIHSKNFLAQDVSKRQELSRTDGNRLDSLCSKLSTVFISMLRLDLDLDIGISVDQLDYNRLTALLYRRRMLLFEVAM